MDGQTRTWHSWTSEILQSMELEGLQRRMLMGRRTRTLLPTSPKLLKPTYNTDTIRPCLEEKQNKQKLYYDKTAKALEPLLPGEQVRLRNEAKGTWTPATVKQVANEPRSYVVESSGREYRRNRRDLLKVPTESHQISNAEPTVEPIELTRTHNPTGNPPVTTRYGRVIKPPVRFINCPT